MTMAAHELDMPAPLPFKVIGENTNLAKSWELYLKRFDYYLNASGVTKDEQRKLCSFTWLEKKFSTFFKL